MRYQALEHRFIDHFPDKLEGGILYVSIGYGSVAHSCCCGCGEEVVTPLSPTDWRITYNGDSITLSPSVGNWTLPCRSHYLIDRGRVVEALPWTDSEIEFERLRDRRAKQAFYGHASAPSVSVHPNRKEEATKVLPDLYAERSVGMAERLFERICFWKRHR